MAQERRQHDRSPAKITVNFSTESDQKAIRRGVVENSSTGGMYITTDHPVPRGTTVLLRFQPQIGDNSIQNIQIHAVVRWVRQVTNPHGMGVEFIEFTGITEHAFNAWLAQATK